MTAPLDRVKKIFDKTHLACFGRFVIAVPEDANIVYGPTQVDGTISMYRNDAANLSSIVASRLSEVEDEKLNLPKYLIAELPLIGKVIEEESPVQKIVFGPDASNGYTLHSYIPLENNLFILEVGRVSPEIDEIPRLRRFAEKLRSRAEREIPVGPGICIDGGFIEISPEHENSAFGLRFKEFPDVSVSISTRKNGDYLQEGSSPKLLREKAKAQAGFLGLENFFANVKILRNGRRQLNGWEGEELLTRRPAYKDDTDAHEFRFFSLGERNDPLHPLLDIRLDSGVHKNAKARVRPSLSDEEALALWDNLLSTIRVRQPSDATPSKEVKPKTPLGTVSKSGEACPQTGFWECTDKRRVDGDRRRLLKEGEKIPPVVVTGHVSFLRTLIGDVHRVAQVEWTLTAYEPMPAVPGDLYATPGPDNPANDTHA